MKEEISACVNYLGRFVSKESKKFENILQKKLSERYSGHWYEDTPLVGSGYRTISIDLENGYIDETMDETILEHSEEVGLSKDDLVAKLPSNLVIFINPGKVKVRDLQRAESFFLYAS